MINLEIIFLCAKNCTPMRRKLREGMQKIARGYAKNCTRPRNLLHTPLSGHREWGIPTKKGAPRDVRIRCSLSLLFVMPVFKEDDQWNTDEDEERYDDDGNQEHDGLPSSAFEIVHDEVPERRGLGSDHISVAHRHWSTTGTILLSAYDVDEDLAAFPFEEISTQSLVLV